MDSRDRTHPLTLRLITYLSPSIPIEYFELLKEYLEEKLKCSVYLITESRWSGPPEDRIDPYTTGDADIGFSCAPTCQRLLSMPGTKASLLGVAPLYTNPHNTSYQPVYYTEMVVHNDNRERFKEFGDLRGSSWCFNDKHSMSGHGIVLRELQKMGESIDFFGKVIKSGSHLNSIQMILNKDVDCTGLDSNALAMEMRKHPDLKSRLHVVRTLGPMPIYAAAINSQLPEDLKTSIATHLLNLHEETRWRTRLNEYMVTKFVPITMDHFRKLDV